MCCSSDEQSMPLSSVWAYARYFGCWRCPSPIARRQLALGPKFQFDCLALICQEALLAKLQSMDLNRSDKELKTVCEHCVQSKQCAPKCAMRQEVDT